MKRLLVVFFLLLSVFSVSFAEGLDLSTLSYEELCQLKDSVDMEYDSRLRDDVFLLYPGRYVIGDDLKPGLYYLTPGDYGDEGTGYICLYENTQKETDRESLYWSYFALDEVLSFTFAVGNVVMIDYVPLKVSSYPFDSSEFLTYELAEGVVVPQGVYRAGVDFPVGRYEIYPGGVAKSNIYIYYTEENYANDRFKNIHGDCDATVEVYPTTKTQPKTLQVDDENVFVISNSVVMRKHEGFVFE